VRAWCAAELSPGLLLGYSVPVAERSSGGGLSLAGAGGASASKSTSGAGASAAGSGAAGSSTIRVSSVGGLSLAGSEREDNGENLIASIVSIHCRRERSILEGL
jgi:hypothetical protein